MMMQIWLPKEIISTDEEDKDFLQVIQEKMANIRRRMRKGTKKVVMPKFEIDYNQNIKEALEAMGIVDVFGPMADLSPMLGENQQASVSKVNHAVKLSVDEKGIEGAAVTVAVIQT